MSQFIPSLEVSSYKGDLKAQSQRLQLIRIHISPLYHELYFLRWQALHSLHTSLCYGIISSFIQL